MNISIVPPHMVDGVWGRLEAGMARACKYCLAWTPGALWQSCRSGNAYLIVVTDENHNVLMASVWSFRNEGGQTVFQCHAMYGQKMKEWLDGTRQWISDVARKNGASFLVADGRDGWGRVFGASRENEMFKVKI